MTAAKTAREFAASILDDDASRKYLNKLVGNEGDSVAWQAFKQIAAYKRGSTDQRKFFDTVLSDEKERESWGRFLQSKTQTVAREAFRLAKRYGVPTQS
jgi:hypothetical protein